MMPVTNGAERNQQYIKVHKRDYIVRFVKEYFGTCCQAAQTKAFCCRVDCILIALVSEHPQSIQV